MNKVQESESSSNRPFWIALGLSLLMAIWIQWPLLVDMLKVNEDLRNLYWLHRMIDTTLFANDKLIGHQLLEIELWGKIFAISKFSPGYGALFFFSKLAGSVILFNKLLIFPLLLISNYYLYRLGQTFTTNQNALALSIGYLFINLFFSSNISVVAGLQRSFALPLLIALLYYLAKQYYWRAGLILFLGSTIYPPIFILGTATFGMVLVHIEWDSPQKKFSVMWKPLLPLGTAVILSVLLLLPALLTQQSDQISQSLNQVSSFFDLGPLMEGRYPLFTIFPISGTGGLFVFGSDALNATILALLALGMRFLLGSKNHPLPRIVLVLLSASIICFIAAWVAIFLTKSFPLYFPSRYTQTTFVLVSLIYIILNGEESMQHAASKITNYSRKPLSMITGVSVIILTVFVYGWYQFPNRQLFFNFSAALGFLWLILVGLLLVRNVSNATRPLPDTITESTKISAKNWAILGFCIFFGLALYGRILDENMKPTEAEQTLFAYLETLPKDIRLAGNPCDLNNIPLYAQRMILFSCETPHTNPVVMQEALESYYAADRQTVNQFCAKYDVDYLLINQDTFSQSYLEKGEFLFEPFDTLMQDYLATHDDFALKNLAIDEILFQNGSLMLTGCPLQQ